MFFFLQMKKSLQMTSESFLGENHVDFLNTTLSFSNGLWCTFCVVTFPDTDYIVPVPPSQASGSEELQITHIFVAVFGLFCFLKFLPAARSEQNGTKRECTVFLDLFINWHILARVHHDVCRKVFEILPSISIMLWKWNLRSKTFDKCDMFTVL